MDKGARYASGMILALTLLTRLLCPEALAEPGATVAFFGDAGTGEADQTRVAELLARACAAGCDGVALLGDNFYDDGVSGPDDPLWDRAFVQPYGALGLRFHPALGNHDMGKDPDAQVGWTAPAGTASVWDMPARRYTWVTGPVTLIALDTNVPDAAQRRWLKQQIREAETPWVVVYGHHPLWSGGGHGDTEELRPYARILKSADVILSGHDHDAQVIQREGLVQVVMGTGGAGTRPTRPTEGTLYAASHLGLGLLRADAERLTITVLDLSGATVFERTWTHAEIDAPASPAPDQPAPGPKD